MHPAANAAVSGGLAAAVVGIVAWIASIFGLAIPDNVQGDIGIIATAGFGYFFHTQSASVATLVASAKSTAAQVATAAAGTAAPALLLCALLAGCGPGGTLTPEGKQALINACAADAAAVPVAKAGATIAATVDPTIAPEVALANVADQVVHPAVQGACAGLTAPTQPPAAAPAGATGAAP